jgi:nucleotidyltransferase substrate binding protein (TIGR01987 family)
MSNIFDSFKNSVDRFEEILGKEKTVANRDSAIKRFELTFELAWKSMQKKLREQGIVCRSPRSCFKEFFSVGFMKDDERWLDMIETRNSTIHTYSEKLADEVYKKLPEYLELFRGVRL